jgi:hypothetical protein
MQENNKPTTKTLREFGFLVGGIGAGLFGAALPLLKGHALPWQPWLIGSILAALGLVLPQSLAPVYRLWMKLGLMLGWINSRIILSIVFIYWSTRNNANSICSGCKARGKNRSTT